jgi:hypothetical protein
MDARTDAPAGPALLERPRARRDPPRCASCGREVLEGVFAGGRWFCGEAHRERFAALQHTTAEALRRLEHDGRHA